MDQACHHCRVRMYVTRKSPHPTLWPGKILAIYECPKCGQLRECIENGQGRMRGRRFLTLRNDAPDRDAYFMPWTGSFSRISAMLGKMRPAAWLAP